MQKTSFFSLILRGAIIGLSAAVVFFTSVYAVAFAADNTNTGGRFGEILNNILASGNWQTDTTGTVRNAQRLGGETPDKFIKNTGNERRCAPNKCVIGIDAEGGIMCEK